MSQIGSLFPEPLPPVDVVGANGPPSVVDDLPQTLDIADGELFIIRNCESRYLTHLFHKYAGKFIPHVPRWALQRYLRRNQRAVVLDPFVGSGTTLVECRIHGQHGYGIDIDPLARLIARTKITLLPKRRLRTLVHDVIGILDRIKEGSYVPQIPTLSHWFTDRAVADLSAIYEAIRHFEEQSEVFDFLLVCFSSIIRRVSNADNQTMKTYVSHTHPPKPEPARPLFETTLRTYVERLQALSLVIPATGSATVLDGGDARSISDYWMARKLPAVDLAITSPPYIKSVDYIYNQMAELFWIGERWGLETQKKQNVFKQEYVGHDRVRAKDAAELYSTGIPEIDRYIKNVFQRRPPLALIMWRYFESMRQHFTSMRSILRSGAHYIVVVGDSTLASVPVPTHYLVELCARESGFSLTTRFGYEIRNKHMRFPRAGRGGLVIHDWILDLQLTGNPDGAKRTRAVARPTPAGRHR